MKSLLRFATLAMLLTASAQAFASNAGGAGCVDSNGHIKTLYYCGAYHDTPVPQAAPPPKQLSIDGPSQTPPEVLQLMNYISKMAYLDQPTKDALISAIKPSFKRKYFSTLAAPSLTAPIVERIKLEFKDVTGLDPQHLQLYAVTDTNAHMSNYSDNAQVTYLLPGFFALPTPEQKMVALFHESLWVMQPGADYSKIVSQEMKFEAVFAQPNSTTRMLYFVNEIEQDDIRNPQEVSLILKHDIETGALKGFLNKNNEFTNLQLFGQSNIRCFNKLVPFAENKVTEDQKLKDRIDECLTSYENYLDGLRRAYPNSQFLAFIGGEKAKDILNAARIDADGYTDYDSYSVITSTLNNYVCFISGVKDYTNSDNCNLATDAYAKLPGTSTLIYELASKAVKDSDLNFQYVTLTKNTVWIRAHASGSDAGNGALTAASAPYIPPPPVYYNPYETERPSTCILSLCL